MPASIAPLLSVENLVKRYSGLTATDNLTLSVMPGELHAIIGPNGAGKTTLIHQLGGGLDPTSGRIVFDGIDITRYPPWRRSLAGLGRSYQITSIFPEMSALENVVLAVQAHRGHNFHFWRPALRDESLTGPAFTALAEVGIEDSAHTPAGEMAHGEKRQLEIAMALVTEPRLLLLDEPMAGMSHHESAKVVAMLTSLKRRHTILLVEHDMDAVFALADRITVLVYGRAIATGTVEEIRGDARVREAYLGTQEEHV